MGPDPVVTTQPVRTIGLHGPESVGKSVMGEALAARLGCELIGEYGRDYCEVHGTDLAMADLVEIGRVQTRLIEDARSVAQSAGSSPIPTR